MIWTAIFVVTDTFRSLSSDLDFFCAFGIKTIWLVFLLCVFDLEAVVVCSVIAAATSFCQKIFSLHLYKFCFCAVLLFYFHFHLLFYGFAFMSSVTADIFVKCCKVGFTSLIFLGDLAPFVFVITDWRRSFCQVFLIVFNDFILSMFPLVFCEIFSSCCESLVRNRGTFLPNNSLFFVRSFTDIRFYTLIFYVIYFLFIEIQLCGPIGYIWYCWWNYFRVLLFLIYIIYILGIRPGHLQFDNVLFVIVVLGCSTIHIYSNCLFTNIRISIRFFFCLLKWLPRNDYWKICLFVFCYSNVVH